MGALALLRKLLAREAPAQSEAIRRALRLSAQSGNEASIIGSAAEGLPGRTVIGKPDAVIPSAADRRQALARQGSVVDFHTHPQAGVHDVDAFSVRPSDMDFGYFHQNYPEDLLTGRELRTLIAVPPELATDTAGAYNFFATNRPQAVFSKEAFNNARFELQRAGAAGRFNAVKDNPAFQEYFDYGGELGNLLSEAAPLALLRYRAGQGLGRHEMVLGGRRLTPDPASTESELFKLMQGPALDVLRERGFAKGGLARYKECNCG